MKKISSFSTHDFETKYLEHYAEKLNFKIDYHKEKLTIDTAQKVKGSDAVLCWANDELSKEVLEILKEQNVKLISLRCAGFSNMDINYAKTAKFSVMRVCSYSPESIAEHACAMYMSLNRNLISAFKRTRDFNFSLEGLEGEVVQNKTIGIIGYGKIGQAFAKIMRGFGCKIQFYDDFYDGSEDGKVELDYLLQTSDVISLHCPLKKDTYHLLNKNNFKRLKPSAIIINTGRGALIETRALIDALKNKTIRAAGLDVYEFEEDIFFNDLSNKGIEDEDLMILMSMPQVLITSHQAFFTKEALDNIARISLENLSNHFNYKEVDSNNILI